MSVNSVTLGNMLQHWRGRGGGWREEGGGERQAGRDGKKRGLRGRGVMDQDRGARMCCRLLTASRDLQ